MLWFYMKTITHLYHAAMTSVVVKIIHITHRQGVVRHIQCKKAYSVKCLENLRYIHIYPILLNVPLVLLEIDSIERIYCIFNLTFVLS